MAEGQAIPVPAGVTMQQDQPQSGAVPVPAGVSAQPEGAIPVPAGITAAPEINPATQKLPQPEHGLTAMAAQMLPQGSEKVLSALNKGIVQPFNRMAEYGAEKGKQDVRNYATMLHLSAHPGEAMELLNNLGTPEQNKLWDKAEERAVAAHPRTVGAAEGAASMAGGFITDPRNWPFLGMSSARPLLKTLTTMGFSGMMSKDAISGIHQLYEDWGHLTPEQRAERATQLGINTALAALTALHLGASAKEGFQNRVTPQMKEVNGTQVPVQNPSLTGRAVQAAVDPAALREFTETKTQPAVQQGIGEVAKASAGSEAAGAKVEPSAYDPTGMKGVAEHLIEEKARPAWQYIDKLSDGKMTDVQKEIQDARYEHDDKALEQAYEHRDALYSEFHDDLQAEGIDTDQIDANYRKGKALEQIARRFDKSSITKEGEFGDTLMNGKNLRTEVEQLVKQGDLLDRAGFTEEHIQKLRDLANVLKGEQAPKAMPKIIKSLAKLASFAVGAQHFGVEGAFGGILGEGVLEQLGQMAATRMFGDMLMRDPAPLTEAIRTGNVDALQNEVKNNPSLLSRIKQGFLTDIRSMISGSPESQRGSFSMKKIKAPAGMTDAQINELKSIGMTDEDIEGLKGTVSGGATPATAPEITEAGGHAGGGVTSVEEQSRPGTHYVVDKSGNVTYHGKQYAPESIDETKQAHVTALPNGEIQTNAGNLSPKMEQAVKGVEAARKQTETPQPMTRQEAAATPESVPAKVPTQNEHLEIGTRLPYKNVKGEKVVGEHNPTLMNGIEAINAAEKAKPGYTKSLLENMAAYEEGHGMPLDLEEIAKDPQAALDKVIEHLSGNLQWLHDQIPEAIRGISKQWYDSAHVMTKQMADRFGISHEKMAAVVAALSPKNGWDNNVGQAERLVDHWVNHRNHEWSPEMDAKLSTILKNKKLKPAFRTVLSSLRGKTYSELTAKTPEALLAKKALWIRMLDEAHNSKQTPVYAPDGTVRGHQALSWGMPDPMAKAIGLLESNGTVNEIHDMMGTGHKIRNFYNNIINPDSPNGHATIDTHAVNADMLKPMGSDDEPVTHNFSGAPANAPTGQSGTYSVHYEAYKRAAQRLGLKPRELQSITWEGVRALMGEEKKTPALKKAVTEIWKEHAKGNLTIDEARNKIVEAAGGFDRPVWQKE